MLMDESKREHIQHPFPPLYDKGSRILILGSFPSVKSREQSFFYGHPQNRFWKMISAVLSEKLPITIEEKAELLHRNHIALWDVIESCDIIGSSDSSIKNVVANDLTVILATGNVRAIYCNGAKSYEYYKKYQEKVTGIPAIKLPSTSPANAACSLDKLIEAWKQICQPLKVAPAGIGETLLTWYSYNSRILPWRSDPSPYHVWVSEIMLQQTRVEAVKNYYARWMEALPDIPALAQVDDDRLMKLWEGLGYYNRARNLKAAARTIMEAHEGRMPDDYDKILALKGIGEYTAGAIASIAFGQDKTAVDGNALRVYARILAHEGDISKIGVKKELAREVARVLPSGRAGDYNQALMDLGATVCLPNGATLCEKCPWEASCQARKLERQLDFPVKAKKKARRIEEKAVFVMEIEGEGVIIHKRPGKGLLADLWEYPNLEGAYSIEKARDQLASWGLSDYQLMSMGKGKHIFSHVEWHMTGYLCRFDRYSKALKEVMDQEGWIAVSKGELKDEYAIPSAFECFGKQIV